jgi:acyl-CoA reductase-like NAD-dependent aldehyde dehydrogenase
MRTVQHFVSGKPSEKALRYSDVFNPASGEVQAWDCLADTALVNEAIRAAQAAQPAWGKVAPQRRPRVMFRLKALIELNMDQLNVPIPVPVSFYSFGGWKRPAFGDLNQFGVDGIRFFTRVKTVTERWPEKADVEESSFYFPVTA